MNIQRKISEAQTKKYTLTTQLNRLKDSKSVYDMKNKAVSSGGNSSGHSSDGGFKFYHLIIFMVLGLILGSYVQNNYIKVTTPVVMDTTSETINT